MTKVTAIKCNKCGYAIYSRTRHDFHSCECGDVCVDGGFDYLKVCYNSDTGSGYEYIELEIDATKEELYQDWNKRVDKYGKTKV